MAPRYAPRHRPPRRIVIDFERLLSADQSLAAMDGTWIGQGYRRSSARLWRRRDGTYTARVVWRNHDRLVSAVTFTVEGIVLA